MFRDPFITDEYRRDGRKCDEMRAINCKLGTYPSFDGSAIYWQGTTQVLATVNGPKAVCVVFTLEHN